MEEKEDLENDATVGLVCVRCGAVNDERASRCSSCRTPLDDFSSSSPWEMGKVSSAGYSEPTSPRTKPIIFYGVWLYFGPSALFSIWAVLQYLEDRSASGGLMMLMMPLGYGLLSIWALWSVTKGYLGKAPPEED